MSESFNGFYNGSKHKEDNIDKVSARIPNSYKVKRVVIVDDINNYYTILSNNMFLSNCFLLKIEDHFIDDKMYEDDIIIKIGYKVSENNNKEIAEKIYTNIIASIYDKELLLREDSNRENYSEIYIGVKEYILTGKTCPNRYNGNYKIICNGLTPNDISLIEKIDPIIRSHYDYLFVNQINLLDNKVAYGDDNREYNIINYIYNLSEGSKYDKYSLTIFNSEFYHNANDIAFHNVDGLIINSSFKSSNIKNLSLTTKNMEINCSDFYCESEIYRHRLRNLLESDAKNFYNGKTRYQISLFNTELIIYSDSQDPDGNGLEPDEGGYSYIDIPNVIKLSNGCVCIDAGSIPAYSTVRTNNEEYNVNFSGMSGIDEYACFICPEPSKDHTVKYLGSISLFDNDMKLSRHDVYLFNRDISKMIFIRYEGVQLTIDSLLAHLKRTNKKLYDLNKNIISGYSKAILLNKI